MDAANSGRNILLTAGRTQQGIYARGVVSTPRESPRNRVRTCLLGFLTGSGQQRVRGQRIVSGARASDQRQRLPRLAQRRVCLRRLLARATSSRNRSFRGLDRITGLPDVCGEPGRPFGDERGVRRFVATETLLADRPARLRLGEIVTAGTRDRFGHDVRLDLRVRAPSLPAVERTLSAVTRLAPVVLRSVVARRARRGRGGDRLVPLGRVARRAGRAELREVTRVGHLDLSEGHRLSWPHAGGLVSEASAVAPPHQLVLDLQRRLPEPRRRLVEPPVRELQKVGRVENVVDALGDGDVANIEIGIIDERLRAPPLRVALVSVGERGPRGLQLPRHDVRHLRECGGPLPEHAAVLLTVAAQARLLARLERLCSEPASSLGDFRCRVACDAFHSHLEHVAWDGRRTSSPDADVHLDDALMLAEMTVSALQLARAMGGLGPATVGRPGFGGLRWRRERRRVARQLGSQHGTTDQDEDQAESEGRKWGAPQSDTLPPSPGVTIGPRACAAGGAPIGGGSLCLISLWQRTQSIVFSVTWTAWIRARSR